MTWTKRNPRAAFLSAPLAAALLSLPLVSVAAPNPHPQATGAAAQTGNPASAEAQGRLDKKQYRDVKANVENGIRWLADNCKAGRFGSTQSTVLALRDAGFVLSSLV